MKKVLSLLIVVSLLASANMFAMQAGDASKVQALITSGKATEQTLANFAKVSGKLKDKMGVTDADYKAWLAEKGGGAPVATGEEPQKTTAVVTPQKPGPAPKKGVVITEAQIAALDKEVTSMANLYFTLQSRTEALAMSTGTQEDAHAFMDAMKERHEEIFKKMDQSRKKPDFSSLPHKQKSPLTLQEKEAYKTKLQDKFNDLETLKGTTNLREFDQKWALGFINRELDDDYKEHDDAFFEEVIKSQGWRKNKIKEF